MKMKMKMNFVFCFLFYFVSCPLLVFCDEQADVSKLKKILMEQSILIENLSNRVKALEEKKYSDVSAMPLTLKDIAPKSIWTERIHIKGDFRYRHEIIREAGRRHNRNQAERDSRETTRNRERIRVRIGLYAEINDDLDFAFQIASGSEDPVSTNQTLENFFESKSVNIDLAYLTWHPEYLMGMNVSGFEIKTGKMLMPFYKVNGSQLIWDDNLRPEGIHGGYSFKIADVKLCINAGGFWIDEDSNDVDQNLWGVQGYFKSPFIRKDIKIVSGLSYYDYGSIKDHPLYNDHPFGNTAYVKPLNPTRLYKYDYDILEGFVQVHFDMYNTPFCVFSDFASNTATSGNNNACQFGASIGKCKKPGSWKFSYDWRRLQSDALFGLFPEASFSGGGTDNKGSTLKINYQLAKHTRFTSTLYLNRIGLEDGDGKQYRRVQFDLKVKF